MAIADWMNEKSLTFVVSSRHDDLPPLIERHLDDRSAQPSDGLQFCLRGMIGDDGRAWNSESPGVPRHALGHIAGARGEDPIGKLNRCGLEHSIAAPPDLERANGLEVFEL